MINERWAYIMSVGELIKKHRKEKKITLKELGGMVNLSYSYLSQIESGTRQPSPNILERLSEALNVPHIELMIAAGFVRPIKIEINKDFKPDSELSNEEFKEKLKEELKEASKRKGESIKQITTQYDQTIELSMNNFLKNVDKLMESFKEPNIDKNVLHEKADSLQKQWSEISARLDEEIKEDTELDKELNVDLSDTDTQIEVMKILNSDIPLEIKGKPLSDAERKKLIKVAETMFSE